MHCNQPFYRAAQARSHYTRFGLLLLISLFFLFAAPPAFGQGLTISSVTPDDAGAGSRAIYTVLFTAQTVLPADGRIQITFPAGFNITGVTSASGVPGAMNGGFLTPTKAGQVLTLTRDGSGDPIPINTPTGVLFSLVTNHQTAGSYSLTVQTQQNNGAALSSGTSPNFSIVPGPLDRFLVSTPSPSPTAGSNFSLTITAKDAFNNTLTGFNNSVNLTDNTTTLLPATATLANGAATLNNARITKAQSGVIIRASGNGKFGESNPFTVNPGAASQIVITPISSPQRAGTPFLLTATAFDASGNLATSLNNNAAITTSTGTITPQNGSFVNGVLTQNITFQTTGTGNATLTVQSGSISGVSNSFTVQTGEPFGTITLTATPGKLPADSTKNPARIKSGTIVDSQGNPVGPGRLFTVVVSDNRLGKIDTLDADPGSPSFQVTTNAASQLSFPFRARNNGGTATIHVTGGSNGSASGSVAVSVNQLRILSITAEQTTVSTGQSGVPVTMIVQNVGRDPIQLTSASLTFNSQTTGYSSDITSNNVPTTIPGNFQTVAIAFSVDVRPKADPGNVIINGVAGGSVNAPSDIVDSDGADVTDSWLVQTAAELSVVPGSLNPKSVSRGSSYQFSVNVQNTGQSTIVLTPAETKFEFGGATKYTAFLDANQITQIAGNSITTLTFQRTTVPTSLTGPQNPVLTIRGRQNGALFTPDPIATEQVIVQDADDLEIVSVVPSQNTVTRGMAKDWTITLEVRNNSGLNMSLTQATLAIQTNGQPDTYQINAPSSFRDSGNNVLPADGTDFLEFKITQTGERLGTALVFATVRTQDFGSTIYEASTDGTQGNFVVQSPANLQISLNPSQTTVTRSQGQDWRVTMVVENSGQSDVQVLFKSAPPTITFNNRPDYVIKRPISLEGATADSVVAGGTTRRMDFIIDSTTVSTGGSTISGVLTAREINSGSIIVDDTQSGGGASVTVQTPAIARIDSTTLMRVFNRNRVNTGQAFQVRVKLRERTANEEGLDSVRVRLTTNGNSSIASEFITLKDNNRLAIFEVTAAGAASNQEVFTASIAAAIGSNTKAPAQIATARDDTTVIAIDRPANLRVLSVSTSLSTKKVAANSTAPWSVYVVVQAENEAANVLLNVPGDLNLSINNVLQTDYTIDNPVALNGGGLFLRSGVTDTLEYRVNQVGRNGGDLAITANVTGKDENDQRAFALAGADTIQVLTLTRTRIVKTVISSQPDGGIGSVNTNQTFTINVDVNNIGFERLDSVLVTLRALNNSLPTQQQRAIRAIDNGGTGTAVFTVTAPATPTIGDDLEQFQAQIDAAFTPTTRAQVDAAFDSTAAVRVQTPALLQLQTALPNVANNQLTIGQTFTLRATVTNLGQAEFDNSGRVQLIPPYPRGYDIADNTPRPFANGVPVDWQIIAPDFVSAQDTFNIEMSVLPRDQNDGTFAEAPNRLARIIVDVNESALAITSLGISAPAGAADRVVSTEQEFTVTTKVSASANLSDLSAEMTLPTGYTFLATEPSVKPIIGDSVRWRLKAPVGSHSNERDISVQVTGKNSAGETVPPVVSTMQIRAEARAQLELTPEIVSPAGAQNGKLSVSQEFALRATLRNRGAATATVARVALLVGETGITVQEPFEQALNLDPVTRTGYVEWHATAPASATPIHDLTFNVTQVPVDSNSGEQAQIRNNGNEILSLETLDQGALALTGFRIFAPMGAQDRTLSTEQKFTLSGSATWFRAANITAQLVLPEGAGFVPEDPLTQPLTGVSGQEFYWDVTAPANAIDSAMFKIILTANDESNSNLTLGPISDSLKIRLVKRASLLFTAKISSPAAATDGIVSLGQSFQVTAMLENLGEAETAGRDSLVIALPEGYDLDRNVDTSWAKRTTTIAGMRVATWQILAPDITTTNQSIAVTLLDPPDDINTGADALVVDQDLRQRLNISTEARKLSVQNETLSRRSPVSRGQTSITIAQLNLSDPGAGSTSSAIVVTSLRFYVRTRQGKNIPPGALFKALRLVDADQADKIYGERALTPAEQSNPVQLTLLTDSVEVGFGPPRRVALQADLVESDTTKSFMIAFDESNDVAAIDKDSRKPIDVIDENNRTGSAFQINSAISVLFDAELATFYNYPNPFRPPETNSGSEGTRFLYNLSQDSPVEFKIFTLLGELVWEKTFQATDPQGRRGSHDDIIWNGFNGAGRRVLNGVYLAVIKTHAGIATTKVAVVK
ncbi:hypothetical protein EDS67_24855 [candidate division KSB1 bacterium]|nr:MAG: hypothetical protein EDS67_24855 [candidate division KSB1 bacterium]MCE7944855.1 hypothetical protein [Chlorobi bacterium CHB1]